MVVSPFDRLRSARSQIVEKCRYSTAKLIVAQNTNLVAEKIAVPRTRGSVRRASGFVQIPITLRTRPKIYVFGNCKATAAANKRRKLVLTPIEQLWKTRTLQRRRLLVSRCRKDSAS